MLLDSALIERVPTHMNGFSECVSDEAIVLSRIETMRCPPL